MVSIFLSVGDHDPDQLIAELWAMGTTGIVELESPDSGLRLEAFFDSLEEAREAEARFPGHQPEIRLHPTRDYVGEFQQAWQPVEIGRGWWLAPPWHPGPPPAGRLRIDYRPGMACGSGAHPCTQLCLEALEQIIRPGDALLDVGAGSGILLQAAKLLGAVRVAGCDIEHADALTAAAEAPVFTGSTRSVRTASFDTAIANISAPAAELLLPELERIVRPGGWIVLSGFRVGEESAGWARPGRRLEREGWLALVLERR